MKVPALIMAGGKGERMGLPIEKPLLPFLGKPLIEWVVNAVQSAKNVAYFYIVTSLNTPETEKKCLKDGLRILRTDAKGYHNDLKQAIQRAKLFCPILVIPSDIPAITGKALDRVINSYEASGKDALAVFVPIDARKGRGLSISSTDYHDGVLYAVSGVNIINGAKIEQQIIPTDAIITEETQVLLNVNTLKDLDIAERIMRKHEKVKHK
jgi:adenosylcobinamide-phosphate guanylyltransferase